MKLIENYSDRAIVLHGEKTKEIKETLKQLGGKFNPFLKYEGQIIKGWVFSKKRLNELLAVVFPETVRDIPHADDKIEVIDNQIIEVIENIDTVVNENPDELIKVYERPFISWNKKGEDIENGGKWVTIKRSEYNPREYYLPQVINCTFEPSAYIKPQKPVKLKEKPFIAVFPKVKNNCFVGELEFKTQKQFADFIKENTHNKIEVEKFDKKTGQSLGKKIEYRGNNKIVKVEFKTV